MQTTLNADEKKVKNKRFLKKEQCLNLAVCRLACRKIIFVRAYGKL